MNRFETDLWLPVPAARAFAFFAEARNLNRVTPPWFRFEILTPTPISMAVGTEIDYRLHWRFAALHWRSRVVDWRPGRRFAYEQARGPFLEFRHDHLFEPEAGGVRVVDRLDYRLFGGRAAARWLVAPELDRIFAYRRRRAEALLAAPGGEEAAGGNTSPVGASASAAEPSPCGGPARGARVHRPASGRNVPGAVSRQEKSPGRKPRACDSR